MSNRVSSMHDMRQSALPPPDVAAQYASDALAEHIDKDIARAGGWIGFDRFMELALYTPGLGYTRGALTSSDHRAISSRRPNWLRSSPKPWPRRSG